MDILLSLESCCFYPEHQKTILLGLYILTQTTERSNFIFQLKPWVNPFGKITSMVSV